MKVWIAFLGFARAIRWGVQQAFGSRVSCDDKRTAAKCRMLLESKEHLRTFLRVRGIESTNNAAEQARRHAVLVCPSNDATASDWGSRFLERVPSVATTCRHQGRNVREDQMGCFRAHQSGPRPLLLLA